jgi:hypothetical protein
MYSLIDGDSDNEYGGDRENKQHDFSGDRSGSSKRKNLTKLVGNSVSLLPLLFTKNGNTKLKEGMNLFEIPICDLKDPPGDSTKFETVGDLLYFLNKYALLSKAWQNYSNQDLDYHIVDPNSNVVVHHNPNCDYYNVETALDESLF